MFLFPSGIGIGRNLQQFVSMAHSPMDDLFGNREWRETALVRLLTGTAKAAAVDETLDHSWVQAFCNRVATLGYEHYDAVGPLRNERNVPMYHLLFFSKHKIALKIWRGIGRIDPLGQRSLNYEE